MLFLETWARAATFAKKSLQLHPANLADITKSPAGERPKAKFTSYQWKLLIFLSIATFFEGYDFIALSQVLPELGKVWGLDRGDKAAMYGLINIGTIVAYLLIRRADKWGRRRVLTITIVGYTIFTGLSGFANDPYVFTIAQLLARTFLIGEYCISMVYAAEEFPPEHRGLVIGLMQAMASLGGVFCAGLAPLMLSSDLGWRMVYFAGVLPLVLVAFARRSIKESSRFVADVGSEAKDRPFLFIWSTGVGKRVVQLAIIWGLTYFCTITTLAFWKEFAMTERGFTDGQVATAITIAALVSMPLIFYSGRLLDRIGRRKGATVIYIASTLGLYFSYVLEGQWPLTGALVFGIFGVSATMTVLNAYGTELFPTELRAEAFAWANNLLGRFTYVASPFIIAAFADDYGWGPSVSLTAIGPAIALVLILWWLPETNAKELDETGALER